MRAMTLALVVSCSVAVAAEHVAAAQQPSPLRFEVASIKLWLTWYSLTQRGRR